MNTSNAIVTPFLQIRCSEN